MTALDLAVTSFGLSACSIGFSVGAAWSAQRAKRLDANTIAAARFLLARLDEYENQLEAQQETREFYGHVAPAMVRLRSLLPDADSAA